MIESLGVGRDLLQKSVAQIELLGTDMPVTWTRDEASLRVHVTNWGDASLAAVLKIR